MATETTIEITIDKVAAQLGDVFSQLSEVFTQLIERKVGANLAFNTSDPYHLMSRILTLSLGGSTAISIWPDPPDVQLIDVMPGIFNKLARLSVIASLPFVAAFFIWLFIVTVILQKDVFGRSLGQSPFVLSARQDDLDDLTQQVEDALEDDLDPILLES
ncbi:uncharacterized protein LOC143024336 [Oratosquilla oratoria]|uniref:uncharacterized protein LOC143024336 n=1 Tax=Oratosquilla oratoria TaxID=337810 RepID=UPI003F76D518